MNKKPELSVILPVHNEEGEIENVTKKLLLSLSKNSINFEIICVENGSTDSSLRKLLELRKKYSNIRIENSKQGWGNAVKKGIKESRGKYICYMVSDGQVDPKYVPKLFRMIKSEKFAMVKITRETRESFLRTFNSFTYNLLAKILFGKTSKDINGTPKILYSSLLHKINLKSTNIAIDLELILYLKKNHLKWEELKVNSLKRSLGNSTTSLKSAWEMIMNMLYFKWKLIREHL